MAAFSTLAMVPHGSTEMGPPVFGDYPLIRVERLVREAARLSSDVLRRPSKQYWPYLSPQALSDLRKRGGAIARTGVVMMAEPAAAQDIATLIQRFADEVDGSLHRAGSDVVIAARENQRDDSQQDDARTEILAAIAEGRLALDELTALVDACTKQIASTRTLLGAAVRELERIEKRGR